MSGGEWLDSPNGDGWWRFNCGGATNIYLVCLGRATLPGEVTGTLLGMMPSGWWMRVPDAPHPPPPPLPKSRMVEMTARVSRWNGPDTGYQLGLHVDGKAIYHSAIPRTRDEAIELARREWQIEPVSE